jgi:ABC-type multidrug transport system ATPase subunit
VGAVLELSGVSKRYRRGPLVLDHISLALEPGTLTQLRGGNGSGKSTLLRVACGFSRPTSGRVHRGFGALGFVPDRALPPARMAARDYLDRLGRLAGMKASEIGPAAAEITEQLGLDPGLDGRIGELSRGNQRKVLLAQALMRPADLLVLDEPFTALDANAATALATILRERLQGGGTLLVAIHGHELGGLGRVLAIDAGAVAEAPQPDAAPARLVVVELAGPQPEWTPPGNLLPDGRTRHLVPEADVERLLAAALACGARVLRVGSAEAADR